jgi:hypothetical protein
MQLWMAQNFFLNSSLAIYHMAEARAMSILPWLATFFFSKFLHLIHQYIDLSPSWVHRLMHQKYIYKKKQKPINQILVFPILWEYFAILLWKRHVFMEGLLFILNNNIFLRFYFFYNSSFHSFYPQNSLFSTLSSSL